MSEDFKKIYKKSNEYEEDYNVYFSKNNDNVIIKQKGTGKTKVNRKIDIPFDLLETIYSDIINKLGE